MGYCEINKDTIAAASSSAWRDYPGAKVPYDFDILSSPGCNSTDWFSPNDYVTISVAHGALFIGNGLQVPMYRDHAILAPGILLLETDDVLGSSFGETGRDVVADILQCAMENTSDSATRAQLQSALQMLCSTSDDLKDMFGPYLFDHVDIKGSVNGNRIFIESLGNDDTGANGLHVGMDGFGTFEINRLGMTYEFWGGSPFELSEDGRKAFVSNLDILLISKLSDEERHTVEFVKFLIENPQNPEWFRMAQNALGTS